MASLHFDGTRQSERTRLTLRPSLISMYVRSSTSMHSGIVNSFSMSSLDSRSVIGSDRLARVCEAIVAELVVGVALTAQDVARRRRPLQFSIRPGIAERCYDVVVSEHPSDCCRHQAEGEAVHFLAIHRIDGVGRDDDAVVTVR